MNIKPKPVEGYTGATPEFYERATKADLEYFEAYKELAEKFKAVNDDTTVRELKEILGTDGLMVIVAFNCSGVDVFNLSTEQFEEMTW